uniref:Uncharacterized protein n=1 Tax=Anguilla anguilla TaxID=7936 RepID=A0A0E9P896_ANGAN
MSRQQTLSLELTLIYLIFIVLHHCNNSAK